MESCKTDTTGNSVSYVCQLCKKSFENDDQLIVHTKADHNRVLKKVIVKKKSQISTTDMAVQDTTPPVLDEHNGAKPIISISSLFVPNAKRKPTFSLIAPSSQDPTTTTRVELPEGFALVADTDFELSDGLIANLTATNSSGDVVNYNEYTTIEVNEDIEAVTTTPTTTDDNIVQSDSTVEISSSSSLPQNPLDHPEGHELEETPLQVLQSDDILIKYENYIQCDTCFQIFATQENFDSHVSFCTPPTSSETTTQIVSDVPVSTPTPPATTDDFNLSHEQPINVNIREISGGRRKQRIESRKVEEVNYDETPSSKTDDSDPISAFVATTGLNPLEGRKVFLSRQQQALLNAKNKAELARRRAAQVGKPRMSLEEARQLIESKGGIAGLTKYSVNVLSTTTAAAATKVSTQPQPPPSSSSVLLSKDKKQVVVVKQTVDKSDDTKLGPIRTEKGATTTASGKYHVKRFPSASSKNPKENLIDPLSDLHLDTTATDVPSIVAISNTTPVKEPKVVSPQEVNSGEGHKVVVAEEKKLVVAVQQKELVPDNNNKVVDVKSSVSENDEKKVPIDVELSKRRPGRPKKNPPAASPPPPKITKKSPAQDAHGSNNKKVIINSPTKEEKKKHESTEAVEQGTDREEIVQKRRPGRPLGNRKPNRFLTRGKGVRKSEDASIESKNGQISTTPPARKIVLKSQKSKIMTTTKKTAAIIEKEKKKDLQERDPYELDIDEEEEASNNPIKKRPGRPKKRPTAGEINVAKSPKSPKKLRVTSPIPTLSLQKETVITSGLKGPSADEEASAPMLTPADESTESVEEVVQAKKKPGRPAKKSKVTAPVAIQPVKEANVSRTGRRRIRSTKLLDFVDTSNVDDEAM